MTERNELLNPARSPQNAFWTILLVGVAVHVPILIPYLDIWVQPAAFDILLPSIVIWGWYRGWLSPPPDRVLLVGSIVIAAIVIHSAVSAVSADELLFARLLKESFKLVLIVVHFVLLLTLFRRKADIAPPFNTVLAILAIACPVFIYIARYEPIPPTRTVFAAYLVGLLFFLVLDGEWRNRLRTRLYMITACIAVIATSIVLHSKGMAGLVTAILAWIVLEPHFPGHTLVRKFLAGAAILFTIGGGIVVTALLGANIEFLQHMDTIERSVGIRLELWSVALAQLLESFPFGIGLGQFPLSAQSVPLLAREGHNYVHNSFLGLVVELGLIGVLLGVSMVLVLINATRGWPSYAVPAFLVVVLPPLLIHDGHSIRILLLITALGMARHLQQKQIAV